MSPPLVSPSLMLQINGMISASGLRPPTACRRSFSGGASPTDLKEVSLFSYLQKLMSPPSLLVLLEATEGEGGAGENRTPVQTSNYNAFYMLSLCSVFDV